MLHPLTLLLSFYATFWSIGLARSIPCDTDAEADTFADPPVLELPWGKYAGTYTDSSKNVTLYKNVRYGKAPTGDLRFKKSSFPDAGSKEKQNLDTPGPICMQAGTKDSKGNVPAAKPQETEDCLFLDIYVPTKAFKEDEPPFGTVVYIYGGAFFFGYKDTTVKLGSQTLNLYDGKSLMDRSEQDFIWVVGNYRVGAYGWLAGESMEKDGTPNAGLHDQKLMVEFVKQHIAKVNGDPRFISLWGNSAGASSIMYHLTANGDGTDSPDFTRAVLFSPASQWFFDRKGGLENTFKSLAKKAGCDKPTLSCLRSVDASKLRQANQDIVTESLDGGVFPFGPSIDGSYVKEIANSYLVPGSGSYYHKNLLSIVVSHVYDEAAIFLPQLAWINTEDKFQKFLNMTFPGKVLADIREEISDRYPVQKEDPKLLAQILRVKRIVRDSTLLCNSWASVVSQRYGFAMQFAYPPAWHGSDLLPLTWNKDVDTGKLIDEIFSGLVNATTKEAIKASLAAFAKDYQGYFASMAAYGVPGAFDGDDTTYWQQADVKNGQVSKAMTAGLTVDGKPAFYLGNDDLLNNAECYLWRSIASYIGNGHDLDEGSIPQNGYALRTQADPLSMRHDGSFSSWEL